MNFPKAEKSHRSLQCTSNSVDIWKITNAPFFSYYMWLLFRVSCCTASAILSWWYISVPSEIMPSIYPTHPHVLQLHHTRVRSHTTMNIFAFIPCWKEPKIFLLCTHGRLTTTGVSSCFPNCCHLDTSKTSSQVILPFLSPVRFTSSPRRQIN